MFLRLVFVGTFFGFSLIGYSQSYVPEKGSTRIKVQPVIPIQAYAFPLTDVKILGGPFLHAQQLDRAYLLLLKPDRLLHRFHRYAGLPVKDSIYGGWEQEGLSGHTLGHYLSACALLYEGTADIELKKRIDYVVSELNRCQQARGTGYVGAIPREDSLFAQVSRGEIRSSGFDLNGGWSPWYTVHKVMAGLCDAYLHAGNQLAKEVVVKMADWVDKTLSHLSDSSRLKMLNCEYGGMNEVLANIYSMTGNKKYLRLSFLFQDELVMGQLALRQDPMPGKHSNTNVPKAIGSARQFELTGQAYTSTQASFFWETMVNHHSYVIGGNSNYEYCGPADSLNDRLSDNTCETCNTYNMLKLTRHLFAWKPAGRLMDYYERALYNHILASQHSGSGMLCYFVPLRMGASKQYSDSFQTFTCCVGSGLENHVKYAEQIYSQAYDKDVFVNLYIPSELRSRAMGLYLEQQTTFPESPEVKILIRDPGRNRFSIRLRIPFWTDPITSVQLHRSKGDPILLSGNVSDGYLRLTYPWQAGDTLIFSLPMHLYTESMPDNPKRVAVKYGPLVLAGLLGSAPPDPVEGVPVLLTQNRTVAQWVKPAPAPLQFTLDKVGKPKDVQLVPFYTIRDEYYSIYWDQFTEEEWTSRQAEYALEKNRLAELERATIDHFRIGEMQPERDHLLQATERSYVSDALGRKGREARAGHSFTFQMKTSDSRPCSLVLTYIGDDHDRVFDLQVNGQLLQTIQWPGGKTGQFYDVRYELPLQWTQDRESIQLTVVANSGKTAGRIFGVRTLYQSGIK